jgi:hypothetical protein
VDQNPDEDPDPDLEVLMGAVPFIVRAMQEDTEVGRELRAGVAYALRVYGAK